MRYNPEIHNRRTIRLKGYDYSQKGLYFITLCCQDRQHIFGDIHKGMMCLNLFGSIAWEEWLKTPSIRPNIGLGAFIVMPNHIHGIIEIKEAMESEQKEKIGKFRSPSHTIGAIIRGYKAATTKRIKAHLRNISTGEWRFAPTTDTGEWRFAPTTDKGEWRFAPNKSIWQRNYYEHIIREEKAFLNITNYIIDNPLKWDKDKFHRGE